MIQERRKCRGGLQRERHRQWRQDTILLEAGRWETITNAKPPGKGSLPAREVCIDTLTPFYPPCPQRARAALWVDGSRRPSWRVLPETEVQKRVSKRSE